jgi:hypothetical protein
MAGAVREGFGLWLPGWSWSSGTCGNMPACARDATLLLLTYEVPDLAFDLAELLLLSSSSVCLGLGARERVGFLLGACPDVLGVRLLDLEGGREDAPKPRRSGTIRRWSCPSASNVAPQMRPEATRPCRSTTGIP